MIIYKTTNQINGKFYIGYYTGNDSRYLGSGDLLKKAIEKYGRKNFKRETIDTAISLEELYDKEKFWINKYGSRDKEIGYNIAEGGLGNSGWIRTKEYKLKMSKTQSDGRVKGRNNPNYGNHCLAGENNPFMENIIQKSLEKK